MRRFDTVFLPFAHAESPQNASAIPATNAPSARDQGQLTATSTTAKRTLFQFEDHSPLTSNFEEVSGMNCTLQ